jgi:hypothetical protein
VTAARWWKMVAIAGTCLNACWMIAIVIPPAAFRYFATCTLHLRVNLQGLIFLGALVIALPFNFTFASAAVSNA